MTPVYCVRKIVIVGLAAVWAVYSLSAAAPSNNKEASDTRYVPQAYLLQQLPPAYNDLLEQGKKVYQSQCAVCHGENGGGDGVAAASLTLPPRDFTDRNWMAGQADGGFVVSALYGIPGSSMPAFNTQLSEQDIWSAVAYIRSFSPAKQLVDPQMVTQAPAQFGERVFKQHCSGCHGDSGKGNGLAGAFFITAPRDLTNTEWMAAHSNRQLYNILMQGVSGSPMPAYRDTLSDSETQAVIAYLRTISDTQFKETTAGKGRQLYRNHCAMCHGINGGGEGPTANQLVSQPRDFRNPRWMHAQSDAYLQQVIESGRAGTAMPPFKALLSENDIALLVEYIRRFATTIPGHQASRRGYTQ